MKKIKIAIVEDNKEISELLQRTISSTKDINCGYAFTNAEEAIKVLPNDPPDVVLMDINLPGISGIECVKILHESCPSTQFLMCTVYEDDESIFDALKAGATGYIVKKTPADKLITAIRELHDGGSPMSASIARRIIASFNLPKEIKMNKHGDILTIRERELLMLLSEGLFYKEIADKLEISLDTVKKHCNHIYHKLHVNSKTEAINKVFKRLDNRL
jgi:DNA-binding NarL/FixJ family response regulator